MKRRFMFLLEKVAPPAAVLLGLAVAVRSCYNTHVSLDTEILTAPYIDVTGNMEYTEFKDGSEEIKFTGYTSNKNYVTLCHNFDHDDTIDQMKSYEKSGNSLNLEQVLDRKKDFESNRHLFETADKLLVKFRKKH